jgi:hypothetical protein
MGKIIEQFGLTAMADAFISSIKPGCRIILKRGF